MARRTAAESLWAGKNPMSNKVMLVAGASGLIGAAVVEHFAAQAGWEVVALSRRAVPAGPTVRHLAVDLTDMAACRGAASVLAGVTHVVYTALYEKDDLIGGWQDEEQHAVNVAMLRNLLDALEHAGSALRHLTLLQGAKAYGVHIGQSPVPAKERAPRHPHRNFYWQQEDMVRERQAKGAWTYTVLRPQIVLGNALASPMNVMIAIGVYAAILREQGLPLAFPGGGRHVNGASDSRLIARAAHFAATDPRAANQTYNNVNGDVLCWHDAWPAIAAHFGMEVGPASPLRLAEAMPRHESVWAALVARHGLQELSLAQLVGSSWQYADRVFAYGIETPNDTVMSPLAIRKAGFNDCEDTEDSMLYWLGRLQAEKRLPP
jgi:nucleoside-diphosphate-sugar epimerase